MSSVETCGGSTVIVLTKAPQAGRSKTRLTPPCTPEQAARLAGSALNDTLRAVAASRATRRVIVLDGDTGDWLPEGFEVLAQRGDGLDERLAAAFEDAGPGLLVGMDTPQLAPALIDESLAALRSHDAVLGHALDGGFWAVGLHRPDRRAFIGVPMSCAHTGFAQHRRLRKLGMCVGVLPRLRDVDDADDARAVAAQAPDGEFARTWRSIECALT